MPRIGPRPHYGLKRRVRSDGYVDLFRPNHALARKDGYVFEHRVVAWQHGILTDPENEVHHRDQNKQNNVPSNLVEKSKADHALDHAEDAGWATNQFGTFPVKPRGQRGSDLYPSMGAIKLERPCKGCDNMISSERRSDSTYCTSNCRVRAWKRAHR